MKKLAIIAAAALTLAAIPLAACHKQETERSKYVIAASYDEKERTLKGTADFTYFNSTDNEIRDLQFNLWGNAYREGAQYKPLTDADSKAYYAGASYGGQTVEKVEGCASWEVTGEDENILNVTLNEPVYPDDTVKVTIT
ncbi:MAG: hypothetical protein K2H78_00150, partial [Clostridia bacterium]|nr:hypothetical protein [Clostridia bacterium]